jgi:hypothetical protein
MSRRRNYGFERRRRDELRRAKQQAKRERRTERAASGHAGPEMGEPPAPVSPADQWEWFSPSRGRTVPTPPRARPPSDAPDDWILLTDVGEGDTPPG